MQITIEVPNELAERLLGNERSPLSPSSRSPDG
jgi:hypothetical protein